MSTHSKMLTRLLHIRPNIRVQAKKNDFVEPAEAPGEGRRRIPSDKENRDSALATRDDIGGRERTPPEPEEDEKPHPLKKFLMDVFKIEEIDYEKFNKENKWAIRPNKNKDNKE